MLERLGRREEALASYDRALALDPKDSLTHYNRGSVLKDLKRFEEALASYESAIGLNASYAEAYVNRGNVLQDCSGTRRRSRVSGVRSRSTRRLPKRSKDAVSRFAAQALRSRRWQDYNKAIELEPAAKYLVGMSGDRTIQGCKLQPAGIGHVARRPRSASPKGDRWTGGHTAR